jgi:hypothetical protein
VLQRARRLLVLRQHVRRQQPAHAQRVALGLGERGALVQQRITEQRQAALRNDLRHRIPPVHMIDRLTRALLI